MLALAHAGAAGSPAAGGLNCPTLPIPTLLSSLAPNIRSLSGGYSTDCRADILRVCVANSFTSQRPGRGKCGCGASRPYFLDWIIMNYN